MKIAILTEILNFKSGARAPIEIARALAKNSNVSVVFYSYETNLEEEAKNYLLHNHIKINLCPYRKNILGKIKAVYWIFRELGKEKPDIISGHATMPFYLGASFSRIPQVATYYGTQFNVLAERKFLKRLNLAEKLLEKCLNFIIKLKTKIIFFLSEKQIAISQYTKEEAFKLYGQKINFIHLGAISPTLVIADKLPNQSVTLLSVSRFTPYKGFHHLEEIFMKLSQKFPQLKLIIAGSLGSVNYLNYLEKIKNDKIKIVVNPKDQELAGIYQNADIYVSLDRFLFFGMPILEAASFSIPSVALNYAAASELIQQQKTGFLASDLKEFSFYLEKLIVDETLRKKMGAEAKKFSQKFSWEKTAAEYQKEFQKLIFKNK